jgi:hypothetical protein
MQPNSKTRYSNWPKSILPSERKHVLQLQNNARVMMQVNALEKISANPEFEEVFRIPTIIDNCYNHVEATNIINIQDTNTYKRLYPTSPPPVQRYFAKKSDKRYVGKYTGQKRWGSPNGIDHYYLFDKSPDIRITEMTCFEEVPCTPSAGGKRSRKTKRAKRLRKTLRK